MNDDGHVAAGSTSGGSETSGASDGGAPLGRAIGEMARPEAAVGDYRLVDDVAALDLDLAHRALAVDSYWARGRTRQDCDLAFANSRVAVALDVTGATVGFARAVTDGVTHAWLADVWVEPDHRGQGIGRALVARLVEAPDLVDVRRWALVTSGAQGLYEQFGFAEHVSPPSLMERLGSRV